MKGDYTHTLPALNRSCSKQSGSKGQVIWTYDELPLLGLIWFYQFIIYPSNYLKQFHFDYPPWEKEREVFTEKKINLPFVFYKQLWSTFCWTPVQKKNAVSGMAFLCFSFILPTRWTLYQLQMGWNKPGKKHRCLLTPMGNSLKNNRLPRTWWPSVYKWLFQLDSLHKIQLLHHFHPFKTGCWSGTRYL